MVKVFEMMELATMQRRVRDVIDTLEVCFVCERVSECDVETWEGAAAWVCRECWGPPPSPMQPLLQERA